MTNNGNDLDFAIRLLAEKLTQERDERLDSSRDMFEWLSKVKPPYFKGKVDPTFLDSWIRELENVFRDVNCPDIMKVGPCTVSERWGWFVVERKWDQTKGFWGIWLGFLCYCFEREVLPCFYEETEGL